jgi:hypothetical protein
MTTNPRLPSSAGLTFEVFFLIEALSLNKRALRYDLLRFQVKVSGEGLLDVTWIPWILPSNSLACA